MCLAAKYDDKVSSPMKKATGQHRRLILSEADRMHRLLFLNGFWKPPLGNKETYNICIERGISGKSQDSGGWRAV